MCTISLRYHQLMGTRKKAKRQLSIFPYRSKCDALVSLIRRSLGISAINCKILQIIKTHKKSVRS